MSLESELFEQLKAFKSTDPGSGIANQVTPPAPVAQTAAAQVQPPIEAPKVEPSKVAPVTPQLEAPKPIDLDAIVEDWDNAIIPPGTPAAQPEPVTPVVTQPIVDFIEIAKALNLNNVNDRDTFTKAVSDLKAKSDSVDTLPQDLAKAVEIAKQGGNYLEYLNVTSVNWGAQDPVVLYENYVIDRYTNKDGMVDEEKVGKLLDSMSEDEKEFRGRELQSQYSAMQQNQKQQLEYQAQQQRLGFENAAKQAVDALTAISGFKLSQAHKSEILKDILSGADLKYTDLRSRAEAYALRKYFGKMDEYRRSQIKNSVQSKLLQEVTFPQLDKPGQPAAPDTSKDKRPVWMNYVDELSSRKGFK